MINKWEDEGGSLPVENAAINNRCPTVMFSYMNTIIYCRKKLGHKGHHEMDPRDMYDNKATVAFMQKAVGFNSE